MWRAFLIAGRFLTRLPLPDPGTVSGPDLGRSAIAYPLVGLVIGLLIWGLAGLMGEGVPAGVAAAFLLICWVWVTGALHLDGLADMADAWVGGLGNRERTLEIMKNPASGPMAIVALVLVLLCKWTALSALLEASDLRGLLWTPVLARAALVMAFLAVPYARHQGMGTGPAEHLPRRGAWTAIMVTTIGCLLHFGTPANGMLFATALVFLLWRRAVLNRLNGFTGDTAGALVELSETALLLTAVLAL